MVYYIHFRMALSASFGRIVHQTVRRSRAFSNLARGRNTLRGISGKKDYAELEGGILESFGRMFKNDLKLYVYPLLEQKTGAVITSGNLRVAPNLRHLYAYLLENRHIEGLKDIDEKCLPILSRTALLKLKSGDAS